MKMKTKSTWCCPEGLLGALCALLGTGCYATSPPKEVPEETDSQLQAPGETDTTLMSVEDTASVSDRDTSPSTSPADLDTVTAAGTDSEKATDTAGDTADRTETDTAEVPDTVTNVDSDTDTDIDTLTEWPPDTVTVIEMETDTIQDSASESERATETDIPLICPSWLSEIDQATIKAGGIPLHGERAINVLFTSSLDKAVLTVAGSPEETGYHLVSVSLPDGEATLITTGLQEARWLVPDETLVVTTPAESDDDLKIVPITGGESETIATSVCWYDVTPDASRVLVVRECGDGVGLMAMIDPETRKETVLSTAALPDRYQGFDIVVSPDSEWIAFMSESDVDPPALSIANRDGEVVRFTDSDYLWFRFLKNNTLLAEVNDEGDHFSYSNDLLVYRPVDDKWILLASNRYPAVRDDPVGYKLSPDHRFVLAAEVSSAVDELNTLYSVATDGSGETLLASDLSPFQTNALGFYHAFGFSGDGTHVLYVQSYFDALMAVSMADGSSSAVTTTLDYLSWAIAPSTDAVAYLDDNGEYMGPFDAQITRLGTGETFSVYETEKQTIGMTFTPSGLGLLLEMAVSEDETDLAYFSTEDGDATLLGRWNWPSYPSFTIDPGSCTIIYTTDLTPGAGTFLQPLP